MSMDKPEMYNALPLTPHCVKSIRIQSLLGPYLPVFRLNTEIYSVDLLIQSECEKIQTGKTRNTEALFLRSALGVCFGFYLVGTSVMKELTNYVMCTIQINCTVQIPFVMDDFFNDCSFTGQ